MDGVTGAADTLDVLTRRVDVLQRLADAPAHVRDLVDELDQSRSTINRAIGELEDADLVKRDDDGYAATTAGRLALDRLDAFRGELGDVVAADAVLDPLPFDAPVDTRAVAGSDALLATDPAPYRPLERFHDDLADATRYRALLPALDDPRQVRLLYEHVVTQDDSAELVVAPDLFTTLREEFPRRMAAMAEADGFTLHVGDVPPFAVGLVDVDGGQGGDAETAVHVVVFSERGGVHGTLRNGTPGAVRWADERFEAALSDADDRTAELLPDPDGGVPAVDVDGGAARGAIGRSLSVGLERAGFVELDVPYFREEPVADPTTAWRAGLTVPEVHTGYAVERALDVDGRSDGESRADDGPAMADALTSKLADGTDCVLVGPPGSGKSTVCKQVACGWYDDDRGPVLYREQGHGRPFDAVEDLVVTVDLADGHTLVVVEDAVRPEADAVFDAIDRLGDRDDVSFLLDAREHEWTDPPGDPTEVSAEVSVVAVPQLDDRDAERLVDHFERTVGEDVDVPVDRLREEVREEAAGDDAVGGEILLLLHRLATYADPLAEGRTSLEDAAAELHDHLAPDGTADEPGTRADLALDVCVLANACNAAGLEVDAGLLYAVAEPDEYDAVDDALDRLEGRVLFPREGESNRTVHETWSAAFLDHLLAVEGQAAAGRFGDCVSALLALADDPGRCEAVADHPGDRWALAAVQDDPAAWADETAEAVYAMGRERPKMAPLFGDGDHHSVTLPDACSAAVDDRRSVWLGRMFADGGHLDDALATARRGLAAVPAESRTACRLLGVEADVHVDRGDLEAAQEAAGRQRDLAVELGARDLEAEAVRRQGEAARRQGEYERTREYNEQALDVARAVGARGIEADALNALGVVALRKSDYEQANEHFEESIAIKRDVGDREGEAGSLRNLGIVAFRQGDYEAAREYNERCLETNRELGYPRGEAEALSSLGVVAMDEGDLELAREYLEEGLDIARQVDHRRTEANDLSNLGLVAVRQGDYEAAREYQERSLEINREMGDRQGVAAGLGNLGHVEYKRSEYETAREYFEESLAIKRDLGSRWGEATSLNNLGQVALRQGDYEQAREYQEQGIEIERDIGNREGEAGSLGNLGRVALARGDTERARDYLAESLDLARDVGDRQDVAETRCSLGAVARERGDHERAREHLDDALAAYEEMGERSGAAEVRREQARLALARDDVEAAREHAERARETFADLGERHQVARCRRFEGRVAADAGDPATARERWTSALETFEDVGAPQDALATLERLVDGALATEDDEAALAWAERAEDVLADAPEAVAELHRGWVADRLADLDGG